MSNFHERRHHRWQNSIVDGDPLEGRLVNSRAPEIAIYLRTYIHAYLCASFHCSSALVEDSRLPPPPPPSKQEVASHFPLPRARRGETDNVSCCSRMRKLAHHCDCKLRFARHWITHAMAIVPFDGLARKVG